VYDLHIVIDTVNYRHYFLLGKLLLPSALYEYLENVLRNLSVKYLYFNFASFFISEGEVLPLIFPSQQREELLPRVVPRILKEQTKEHLSYDLD